MVDEAPNQPFDHYRPDLERFGGVILPYAIGRLFERYRWHIRLAVLFAEGEPDDCSEMAAQHNRQCRLADEIYVSLLESLRNSRLECRFEILDKLSGLHDEVGFGGEDRYDEVAAVFVEAYRRFGHSEKCDDLYRTVLSHGCDWLLQQFEKYLNRRLTKRQRALYSLGTVVEHGLCPSTFWRRPPLDSESADELLLADRQSADNGERSSPDSVRRPSPYLLDQSVEPGYTKPDRFWISSLAANLELLGPSSRIVTETGVLVRKANWPTRGCIFNWRDDIVGKIDRAICSLLEPLSVVEEVNSNPPSVFEHKATGSRLCIADDGIHVTRIDYQNTVNFSGGYEHLPLLQSVFAKRHSFTAPDSLIYDIWKISSDDDAFTKYKTTLHNAVRLLNKKLGLLRLRVVSRRTLPEEMRGNWSGIDGYVLVDAESVSRR